MYCGIRSLYLSNATISNFFIMQNKTLFLFLFLGIICLVASCKKVTFQFTKKDSTTFELDQAFGIYRYFKDNQQEYISFLSTPKKLIAVYDLDGIKKMDISLQAFYNQERTLTNYYIKSLDTIILLSANTNNLHFINSSGEIWKTIALEKLSSNTQDDYTYDISRMIQQQQWSNDNYFLFAYYTMSNLQSPSSYADEYDWWVDMYTAFNQSFQLFRLGDLFTENPTATFFAPFPKFKELQRTLSMSSYAYVNDLVILFTYDSNRVEVYNPNTLECIHRFDLHSRYTEIGGKGLKIERNMKMNEQEYTNQELLYGGHVRTFLYDEVNQWYCVFISHRQDGKRYPERKFENAQHSLLLYDKNFKFLDEILLDGKYGHSSSFMTSKGIFVRNLEDGLIPKTVKFDYFNLRKTAN